jgi:threonine/homoserine/homoserine lactone efflux protein
MLLYLIIGTTYGFAAAVQPGQFQTYLISQTMNIGWRRTIPATFAPLISDIPIAVLVLFILNRVPSWFEPALHIIGGLFVLYLAIGAFKIWRKFETHKTTATQAISKAVLINLLNPAPYLGWSLVMGPLFLTAWREAPENGFILLIAFYGTMILLSIGIIILVFTAKNLLPRIDRIMVGFSVFFLAFFGIYQIWMGITLI